MEKFPILCTLSALIVFLGAAISTASVQTGKSKNLPFGSNSVEQIQSSARWMKVASERTQESAALVDYAENPVTITGDILVSF